MDKISLSVGPAEVSIRAYSVCSVYITLFISRDTDSRLEDRERRQCRGERKRRCVRWGKTPAEQGAGSRAEQRTGSLVSQPAPRAVAESNFVALKLATHRRYLTARPASGEQQQQCTRCATKRSHRGGQPPSAAAAFGVEGHRRRRVSPPIQHRQPRQHRQRQRRAATQQQQQGTEHLGEYLSSSRTNVISCPAPTAFRVLVSTYCGTMGRQNKPPPLTT